MAKEIEGKRIKRAQEVGSYPIATTVTSCVLLDVYGMPFYSSIEGEKREPGAVEPGFIAFGAMLAIAGAFRNIYGRSPLYPVPLGEMKAAQSAPDFAGLDIGYLDAPLLIGRNVSHNMRILALDALEYCSRHKNDPMLDRFQIPLWTWYHRTFGPSIWLDPYEVAVPSDYRGDFEDTQLYQFFGISPPAISDNPSHYHAELARQLAIAIHLVPHYDAVPVSATVPAVAREEPLVLVTAKAEPQGAPAVEAAVPPPQPRRVSIPKK